MPKLTHCAGRHASAHTDYGGFTILSGENVPGGLQVRTRDGRWIDARTTPSRFVVNIGDLLMCWTNDRWLSNLHRVVKPPSTEPRRRPRLSIGFFNHPNYDALIASLSGRVRYSFCWIVSATQELCPRFRRRQETAGPHPELAA